MREEVPFWNWWKCTSWSWVAEYRPTGTFTKPNDTDPLQIARPIC
jgi:hypothetical protein